MVCLPRSLAVLGAAGVLLAATACSNSEHASTLPPSAQQQPPTSGTSVNATFGESPAAFNYDKTLVPDRASADVEETIEPRSTTVKLTVTGLVPNRPYGAHVHVKPCGPSGEDAGPHFQHMPDPVTPSVNPAFANPKNEIWLDFTTDAQGNATSTSTVAWQFAETRAGSVVIHSDPTQTGPGKAGMAGARVGCVSVGF